MFGTVWCSYDSTHLAYSILHSRPVMKISLYSHQSSTKWIILKRWAGCTQNGRDKRAADGSSEKRRQFHRRTSISNVVRGRVNRRPSVFRFCICGFELSDGKNVEWCNAGSKPQLSCSTAHNMKSKLINHQSLSCVWINTQRRAEKLFESGWGHSFTTKIHFP